MTRNGLQHFAEALVRSGACGEFTKDKAVAWAWLFQMVWDEAQREHKPDRQAGQVELDPGAGVRP